MRVDIVVRAEPIPMPQTGKSVELHRSVPRAAVPEMSRSGGVRPRLRGGGGKQMESVQIAASRESIVLAEPSDAPS